MCCFQGVRVMSYICFLPDTKNLHKIPKIVHSTVGGLPRRFFRVFINTQGIQKSGKRQVHQKNLWISTKCQKFLRRHMTQIFLHKNFLVRNCVFKGIREKPEFYFLVDMCSTQKICTKSRKLRTRQSEVHTAGFFLFSSILRAGKKAWVDEFDKKKLWISTKCPTFSDKVFFEIFSCTHFFPNFSEKPSWPFLVKIAFSGHFSFFTKSSLFFLEKIVIFFDFFSKKKFAKKHKKTWFCKKCVGWFQGRLQKVQKKTWEKSGFLLF